MSSVSKFPVTYEGKQYRVVIKRHYGGIMFYNLVVTIQVPRNGVLSKLFKWSTLAIYRKLMYDDFLRRADLVKIATEYITTFCEEREEEVAMYEKERRELERFKNWDGNIS